MFPVTKGERTGGVTVATARVRWTADARPGVTQYSENTGELSKV